MNILKLGIYMNNFSIEHEGKTYWVSRSVAVTCCVISCINNQWCVLANKRGKGTPDFQGLWNLPCGYLDYNERTADAAVREVYEETGIKVQHVHFLGYNDHPGNNRQNVVFNYYGFIADPKIDFTKQLNKLSGEQNEVEEIKWIPVKEIENYAWAFGHDSLLEDLIVFRLCLS